MERKREIHIRKRLRPGKDAPRKKSRAGLALTIALPMLYLAGTGALGYAAWRVSRIDTVFPCTRVAGVDLGGMTRDQAAQALWALGTEKYDGLAVTARLPLDNALTISAGEAGLTWSAEKAADAAWRYGREDGMLGDLYLYAQARYLGLNTFSWEADPIEARLDREAVGEIVAAAAADIDAQLLENSYSIEDKTLRLKKGGVGLTLDRERLTDQFTAALLAGEGDFTYESAPDAGEIFDFQTLHDKIHTEKEDARLLYAKDYVMEETDGVTETAGAPAAEADPLPEDMDFAGRPYLVTRSAVGVDFDAAEAERLWAAAQNGDTVTVPLTVTEPETTTEDLESRLFADDLSKNWTMVKLYGRDYCGEVRTSLAGSSAERIGNVTKACEAIDGAMLMPGEAFSFNDTVGERTAEGGWLPAPAYSNGQVLQSIGGGICQVSSTLYNAALYANLEIIERSCHQFHVGYLPWGMDAAVSWGSPDLKFRNNTDWPIKITAWVDQETNECCVQIKGTDVDHQYVIVRYNNWEVYDQTGTYHDANGSPLAVGMAASTWRTVYHDGDDYNTAAPISDEYEAFSSYNYHKEDLDARNVPVSAPPAEIPQDPTPAETPGTPEDPAPEETTPEEISPGPEIKRIYLKF